MLPVLYSGECARAGVLINIVAISHAVRQNLTDFRQFLSLTQWGSFLTKMKHSPFLLQLVIPSGKLGYNPDDLIGQVVIHTFITGVAKESHSSQVIKTNTV